MSLAEQTIPTPISREEIKPLELTELTSKLVDILQIEVPDLGHGLDDLELQKVLQRVEAALRELAGVVIVESESINGQTIQNFANELANKKKAELELVKAAIVGRLQKVGTTNHFRVDSAFRKETVKIPPLEQIKDAFSLLETSNSLEQRWIALRKLVAALSYQHSPKTSNSLEQRWIALRKLVAALSYQHSPSLEVDGLELKLKSLLTEIEINAKKPNNFDSMAELILITRDAGQRSNYLRSLKKVAAQSNTDGVKAQKILDQLQEAGILISEPQLPASALFTQAKIAFDEAKIAITAKDLNKAKTVLEKLVDSQPDCEAAWEQLARLYDDEREKQEEAIREVFRINPNNINILTLARILGIDLVEGASEDTSPSQKKMQQFIVSVKKIFKNRRRDSLPPVQPAPIDTVADVKQNSTTVEANLSQVNAFVTMLGITLNQVTAAEQSLTQIDELQIFLNPSASTQKLTAADLDGKMPLITGMLNLALTDQRVAQECFTLVEKYIQLREELNAVTRVAELDAATPEAATPEAADLVRERVQALAEKINASLQKVDDEASITDRDLAMLELQINDASKDFLHTRMNQVVRILKRILNNPEEEIRLTQVINNYLNTI